jgi:hypothetical protein
MMLKLDLGVNEIWGIGYMPSDHSERKSDLEGKNNYNQ